MVDGTPGFTWFLKHTLMMTNDFFEYHCGFLDERLQFVDATEASADLAREGLFHSWFQWTGAPTKEQVFHNWRQRFSKDSLLLTRSDSALDQVLANVFDDMGVEVRNIHGITHTAEFEAWVRDHSRTYHLTDPKFACFAFLSEIELKKGREVLWTFPVFEIKDMNWQFTDPLETEEIITQDQPHWVFNDFATTLTPYLLKMRYPRFNWGLALEFIPAFVEETHLLSRPERLRNHQLKAITENQLVPWLNSLNEYPPETDEFRMSNIASFALPKGRSYNLIQNSLDYGA